MLGSSISFSHRIIAARSTSAKTYCLELAAGDRAVRANGSSQSPASFLMHLSSASTVDRGA
jgi:hypothetical protein